MKSRKVMESIKRVVRDSELENLGKYLIININGGYELYGEYFIKPENGMFAVTKYRTSLNEKFNSLRHAVTWVTLDKRNSIVDANRLKVLDKMFEGASVSLSVHQSLYKKSTDVDKKLIYFAKIQEDKAKKARISLELDRFIVNSKNWQYRKFKEAAK